MKLKLLLGLALVLNGVWLGILPGTALAQDFPGNSLGVSRAVTNLFTRPFKATVDFEIHAADTTATMVMGLCAADGKIRMYMDLGKLGGGLIDPAAIAVMRRIGQDRWISIDRPDQNKSYEIYPVRRAYIEKPFDPSADSGPEPTRTLQGRETVAGHFCNKYQIAFGTNVDVVGTVWEATDLNGFPVQMEFSKDKVRMKIIYHDIVLGPQDASLFEVPTNYIRYDSPEEMILGKRTPAKIPESKAEVNARVLKWHQDLADKGDAYGELRMGLRYRDGDGVPKDLSRAREWLQKATNQGSAEAATALAKLPVPVRKPTPISPPSETNTNSPVSPAITVRSAEFGAGKNVSDVTARVAELLRTQPDGFMVNADTLGADPLPGKKKRLVVKYDYKGASHVLTIPGGKHLDQQTLVNNASK